MGISPTEPDSGTSAEPTSALPEARVIQGDRGLSLVWLIPLLALAIGGWLAYKNYSERGPVIRIEMKSASGLSAGKTKVKYRDVEIGQVTAIDVSKDLDRVIVTAELAHGNERLLTEKTRVWVAKPRISASGVSGLETMLSGPFLALDPVLDGKSARSFVALSRPPVITTDEPGSSFTLQAATLGSLSRSSPVYFRSIQVGQVIDYALGEGGKHVDIELFILSPHDGLVHENTRFWNASGVDVTLNAEGITMDTQSLVSVLIGGIAFDTPSATLDDAVRAKPGTVFQLFADSKTADEQVAKDKEHYLLVFDGEVRGLSPGAPVRLQGMPIGQVLDLRLRFDARELKFSVPVLVEVWPDRIDHTQDLALTLAEQPDIVEKLVGSGLRAQLKTGSLLTGALYVELGFHADEPEARMTEQDGYPVIPTLPTQIEAVTGRVTAMLRRLEEFPLEKIGEDLSGTLSGTRELANSPDLRGMLSGTSALVNSPELKQAVKELDQVLSQLRITSLSLNQDIAPTLLSALRNADRTMKSADALVDPDALIGATTVRTMHEISGAARAIRDLADYLERHPEALLQGKGGGR